MSNPIKRGEVIYRVQDAVGRGPYRPGFSYRWSDPDGPTQMPWWIEIGEPIDVAHAKMSDPTLHYGCGFDTLDQMHSWFSRRELRTLDKLGFKLVKIEPDFVIARTPTQVVFGSRKAFANARPRISLMSSLARAA